MYFGPSSRPAIEPVGVLGLIMYLWWPWLWSPTFLPCSQRKPCSISSAYQCRWSSLPVSCLQKGQKGKSCLVSCDHNGKQWPSSTLNQKCVLLFMWLSASVWVYICLRECSATSASPCVRWKWPGGNPGDSFPAGKGRFEMGRIGIGP